MSQYEINITYIPGKDNTAADALSHVLAGAFPGEEESSFPNWLVNGVLQVDTNKSVLEAIKAGYKEDSFCQKFITSSIGIKEIWNANGLWYVGDHLLIPHVGNIRENLFCLAHDTSGHFSADKSYASLHDAYYWPNMHHNLKQAYVPACTDCQHNKSCTKKPASPLHPLPIPDMHGDSIAMDFIRPLPPDNGFDSILSITDCLHSDI